MKNLSLLILLTILFSACSEDNTPKGPLPTTITGTINRAPYPNIIFTDDNDRLETQLVNGQFTINTTISQPTLYTVVYGRDKSTVFVNPGDSLILFAEGQRFSKSLNFKGEVAEENVYLSEKALLDRQRYSTKVKDFKLGESEFIQAMDYTKSQNQSAFDKLAKEKNFSKGFIKLMNNEITFEWATDRVNYKLYHEFYNKTENLELSDTYYDFLKDLDYDDASLLGSVQYKNFISNFVSMSVQEELKNDEDFAIKDNAEALAKFNFVTSTFKSQEVIDFLLYSTLKRHIQYEGANGTEELLAIFNQKNKNADQKADIQKDYSVWENLKEGEDAPTFNYADLDGTIHGLENFKGKYVYIDVWATWCGPCRKEIPHLEELQEKYKGNDKIVFTSISIDQDTKAWRKMVSEQEMKGVQLLADGAWQSSIVRDYKIKGIPRFLLIDPNGDIVSANAPRPSSNRIKAKLAHLIEG